MENKEISENAFCLHYADIFPTPPLLLCLIVEPKQWSKRG